MAEINELPLLVRGIEKAADIYVRAITLNSTGVRLVEVQKGRAGFLDGQPISIGDDSDERGVKATVLRMVFIDRKATRKLEDAEKMLM